MKPPHSRLRLARERAGHSSMQAAAETHGWDPFIYRSHETGRRKFDDVAAASYGRAFGVPPEWVLYGRGKPYFAKVEIMGMVGAGARVYPVDTRLDPIDPPPGCPDDAFGLIVRGDSMALIYEEGDVLICVNEPDPLLLLNKRAVVDLDTGERYVKKLVRGSARGLFTLISHNGSVITDVRVERAARILWVKPA